MIMITKKDFEKAKEKAVDELMNDHDLKGDAVFIVPLTGLMFADLVRKYLFKEDEN